MYGLFTRCDPGLFSSRIFTQDIDLPNILKPDVVTPDPLDIAPTFEQLRSYIL